MTTETRPELATHNGFLTLTNPATGQHRTFRIRTETWKDRQTGAENDVRVVGLLSGPDNTADYVNFAIYNEKLDRVFVYRKHRGTMYERLANTLEKFRNLEANGLLDVAFDTTCRKCNRTLTDPLSIELGIGPVCRGDE